MSGLLHDEELAALLKPLLEESVNRFTLDNGLTVVHREDRSSKLVSIQAWVRTGSIHERGLAGSGVSHYLEHMLFKGTGRRSGPQIPLEIQQAGGHINAYTTFDRTVYYVDMPSESASVGFDVLGDITLDSTLPEEEVRRERDVILREIDMVSDDPDRQLSRALFSTAFREHPYRHPVIGYRELFEKLTRDDLVETYHGRYAPNNMVVSVVGDIDRAQLDQELEKTFGTAKRQPLLPAFFPEEPDQLAHREIRLTGDVKICRGSIVFKTPGLAHPTSPALDVLAAALGSGYSSILNQRLREEQRLVHSVDVSCWNPGNKGLFWIAFTCNPEKREKVEAAILGELHKISTESLPDTYVAKARNQAIVSEINARKTVSGQASRLGAAEVVVGDLGFPAAYFSRLEHVTAELMPKLVQRYLQNSRMTVGTLAPKGPASGAGPAPTAARQLPDFELVELENGARILHQVDRRLPKVHLRQIGLGGPLYEPDDQRGITGLMATLLTRDTKYRTAAQVAERIESVGGSLVEFAGNNTFGFGLEVLRKDLDRGMQLLEEGVLYPAFQENTFEIEKEAQIASIREDMDDIVSLGKRLLRKHFFGNHPYAIDAYGRPEDLEPLTIEQIKAQYQRLILSSNTVLSVSGDFDPDELIPKLKVFAGELPSYEFHRSERVHKPHRPSGELTHFLQREQAIVFDAYPGPDVSSSDFVVGEILDEIFSDMSGKLFTRVRDEQGLAYFVSALRFNGVGAGMFSFFAGTHPSRIQDVQQEFELEAIRARQGEITSDELQRAVTKLSAHKRMSLQTSGSRAMQAALNLLYGLPVNDWKIYDDRLHAVSIQDLQNFAQKYLSPEHRLSFVIGPV